jgi:iron complex transport system permease protein
MNRKALWLALLALGALAAAIGSLFFGGSGIPASELIKGLLNPGGTDIVSSIIWKIRLPRVVLAVFVGMGLAGSGCVFQGLLRNPLADPYTLGVSGGAAFGATIAIVTGLAAASVFSLPLFAFLGSLSCFYAVYVIASRKNFSINSLILTGVVFGFIFSSAVLLILTVANPDKLHASIIWLTGDLSSADPKLIRIVAVVSLLGVTALYFFSRELNILTLGEEKAANLGVETERIKKMTFVTASLITGACVSASGIIGFVGLIIPHLMRKIVGPDHRYLIPASVLGGAAFLPLCDAVARTVIAPLELPVGVITGLVGGVFFLIFLIRSGEYNSL